MDFSFEGTERMACQYDGESTWIPSKFFDWDAERGPIHSGSEYGTEHLQKAGIIKPTEQGEDEEADAGNAVDAE